MPLSENVYCVAVACKMTEQVDKWICIRFCIKLEPSSAETIRMIQKVLGDDAMSAAQIKLCHKCFKDGWEFIESDPRSGRPATSRTPENVEHVRASIHKDQWLTVQDLEADLGILETTVSEILMQNLGMKCVVAKFIQGFCYRSRRSIMLQLGEPCEVPKCLLWRGLRCHCPMYNVSCIFFNKCL